MTMRTDLQIRVESYGIKEADAALEGLEQQGVQTERATDALTRAMKQVNEQTRGTASVMADTERAVEALTNEHIRMADAMAEATRESASSGRGIRMIGASANDAGRGIGGITGIVQGLSYQLQDVAVQAQAGTSKLAILGQQGPQILSLLGPFGALAGLLVGVGAATASVLLKATDTSGALSALREDASQLTDAFSVGEDGLLTYNERLQRIAQTAPEVATALFEVKKQQLELEQELSKSSIGKELEGFGDVATEFGSHASMSFEAAKTSAFFLKDQINDLSEEFGGTDEQVISVSKALQAFQESANKETATALVGMLRELKGGSDQARASLALVTGQLGKFIETEQALTTDDPAVKKTKNIQSMVEALQLEAETLGMTARQRDLYVAGLSNATEEQRKAINTAYDLIEAEKSSSIIEGMKRRFMTEEQLLDDNYARNREAIIENTTADNALRMEMLDKNLADYQTKWLDMQSRLMAPEIKAQDQNSGEIATMMEALQTRLYSEEEAIAASYTKRYEKIMEITEAGSAEQNEALRLNLEAFEADFWIHQEKLTAKSIAEDEKRAQASARVEKIIQQQRMATTNSAIGLLGIIAAGNEKAAKAIIAIQTGLNIAMAIQNTSVAEMRALAELGPVLGPPAAAEIAMLGKINVGLIGAAGALQIGQAGGGGGSASSLGGGGVGASYSAPTLAAPAATAVERDPPVQIIFNGPVNGLNAEHIAQTLKEHIEDTDFVLVTSTSRNGRELRS